LRGGGKIPAKFFCKGDVGHYLGEQVWYYVYYFPPPFAKNGGREGFDNAFDIPLLNNLPRPLRDRLLLQFPLPSWERAGVRGAGDI
jgi:hypothetical protein